MSESGERDDAIETARTGAALVDLGARDWVRVEGPDAASFMGRLLTVGVVKMAPGHGARAFMLDARGKAVLGFHLYRLDETRFLAEATGGHGAEILQRLDMFHFGEQIEFIAADGLAAFALHGPKAPSVLAELGLPVPDVVGAHAATDSARVIRRDLVGGPGYRVVSERTEHGRLRAEAEAAGARPVDAAVEDALRIAAGVPRYPSEYGPHSTPLEMGSMDGITEGKGCYPGQEVIERTIAIGRPARSLVRVVLDGPAEAGAAIHGEDKQVGTLTSVARVDERTVGLALIKRRAAGKGGPWRIDEVVVEVATEGEER